MEGERFSHCAGLRTWDCRSLSVMREQLGEVFAWVCGQLPEHTWGPGSVLLPFCQRCTGLYVGATVWFLLHLFLRGRPGPRLVALYGLCLLQMIPFGFHLVPQGPVLRTVSGWLFSFGLVGCLWLLPAGRWWVRRQAAPWWTWCAVWVAVAGGAGLVWGAERGGPVVGGLLAGLGLGGLAVLVLLAALNVFWLAASLLSGWHPDKPVTG